MHRNSVPVFIAENARWLAGGFLLTLFSSYGQTYFISLSAGEIRSEYALSHGGFGALYMIATLGSALTLPRLGQIVDNYSVRTVTFVIIPMLALAAVLMAVSTQIWMLVLTIYLLRLFGQGMMSQNAFTAAGRWFVARRGTAMSITAIGVNAGEATLPFLFVSLADLIGWRFSWLVFAAVLVVVALPLISALVAVERSPRATDAAVQTSTVRDWSRAEVLRDPLFYLILIGVMAPPFIGTTIFFHQVYLVELRGWSLEAFAASFTFMATMVVAFSLITGQLVDRFSAVMIMPAFLVPLSLACLVLGNFEQQWAAFVFMGLLGVSSGIQNTMFGTLWPEVYGVAHLGAIRAAIVAILVFATAVGPGLTGYLIDAGIALPAQVTVMGIYCAFACIVLAFVCRRIRTRILLTEATSDTPAA